MPLILKHSKSIIYVKLQQCLLNYIANNNSLPLPSGKNTDDELASKVLQQKSPFPNVFQGIINSSNEVSYPVNIDMIVKDRTKTLNATGSNKPKSMRGVVEKTAIQLADALTDVGLER